MHTNCELNILKTTLHSTWIYIQTTFICTLYGCLLQHFTEHVCKETYTGLYLHSKNNRQARCLADRQRMLYASLQQLSLVTSHACCISYDNTILVLKSCVSVTDYFQAFVATCMVALLAYVSLKFQRHGELSEHTYSLFF